ncbi:MAG: SLC13 family permease [Planctomycetota bacterium]
MENSPYLFVLGVAIALYATQAVRIEVTSLGVIVALAALGILTPEEALSGFSNPATVTVMCMLILSAGLQRAGVVDYVSMALSRWAAGGLPLLVATLALPCAAFSAFMNNTPVVALMIPVALGLARRAGQPASRVLLPVSYASILGGTCTLFGTSTNILIHEIYVDSGGPGFGVFEFAPLGLILLAVGFGYVVLGARFLPNRPAMSELLSAQAPGRFVAELVLPHGSRHEGRTIAQAFPSELDVAVIEVVRSEEALLKPPDDFRLTGGDAVFLEGDARSVHRLLSDPGLAAGTAVEDERRVKISRVDLRIAEAVVRPGSRFLQRRLRALGLSRRYGIQVLGVRRLGRHHQRNLREMQLRAGDVLLVQGEPSALRLLQEEGDVLLVEGVDRELTFPRRAPIALATLAAVVALATLGVAPIVVLSLAGVAALVATRCIDVRDAVRAVDPAVLLLLAGTFPLGLAMDKTGLARDLAEWLTGATGDASPMLLVGGIYLLTSVLTALISNNAVAVLLTPVVLGIAAQTGHSPQPYLMAVLFGASACFATPMGYQTNALVMGPGGYRFRDYLALGLPLNAAFTLICAVLIPIFWPLA